MKIQSDTDILEDGQGVFGMAIDGILRLKDLLDASFVQAAKLIAASQGKVIFSGVGKSGIIAKKLSSTLSSTGVCGHYIHPVDALHGDLGMIQKEDVLIMLSNSGNSSEVITFLEHVKKLGFNNKIITITAKSNSKIGEYADIELFTHVVIESMYDDIVLQHVPTTSTTVTLVLGDALISAVHLLKNSASNNFIKCHPGGNIGKMLSVKDN